MVKNHHNISLALKLENVQANLYQNWKKMGLFFYQCEILNKLLWQSLSEERNCGLCKH